MNQLCDVHTLWCHIHYGCDVFVTMDRNFYKVTKRQALADLGAKRIIRPVEATRL